MLRLPFSFSFFFFNDTATTEIYTLSLHDALPISLTVTCGRGNAIFSSSSKRANFCASSATLRPRHTEHVGRVTRSEEHTSELQSQSNLVCRLLLEKKKKK